MMFVNNPWTRSSELFWLAVFFIVFVVSIYRKKVWSILTFSIFLFPIHEIWKIFQNILIGFGGSTAGEVAGYTKVLPTLLDVNKWGQVLVYLYKYVVIPWGGIFAAFILAAIAALLLKKKKLFLIFFIVFVFLGVFVFGTYFFTAIMPNWFAIVDAAERLSMFFYSLFIYALALNDIRSLAKALNICRIAVDNI